MSNFASAPAPATEIIRWRARRDDRLIRIAATRRWIDAKIILAERAVARARYDSLYTEEEVRLGERELAELAEQARELALFELRVFASAPPRRARK
jgi:hypothetical protein